MKHRNPLAVWIGLPIITLGIYSLVWHCKIHQEMAAFDRRREMPVAGPMLVILFLGWTVVAPLICSNNAGQLIRCAQRAAGLAETCNPLPCWLLAFALGLHTWYMQNEPNKVVDRYEVETGTMVPLFARDQLRHHRNEPAPPTRSRSGCGKNPRTRVMRVHNAIGTVVNALGRTTSGASTGISEKNIATMMRM